MWGGRRGCSRAPSRLLVGDEEQLFMISGKAQQPLLNLAAEGHGWTDGRSPPRLDMDKRGTRGSGVARSGVPRPRAVLAPAQPPSCARPGSLSRYGARSRGTAVRGDRCSSSSRRQGVEVGQYLVQDRWKEGKFPEVRRL